MKTKEQVLNQIEDDGITFTLMLTEQCNFKCGHCFYSCGPDGKKGYMKPSVYLAALDQIFAISDRIEHPNIKINLIGGEPTLNMDEFEAALSTVFDWLQCEYISGLEITTNGWWLHKEEDTIKFFGAISNVVPESYLGLDNGFVVRVSNDAWHDEFRPDRLKSDNDVTQTRDRLKYALSDTWDSYILFGTNLLCEECEVAFKEWVIENGDDCPISGCSGDIYEDEFIHTSYVLPNPEESTEHEDWIYVEKHNGDPSMIMPLGRGEAMGSNDKCRHGGCNAKYGGYLTYRPDGTLSDICCSGSEFPAGTCHDDPFELLAMAMDFGEQQASCYGCHEDAKKWLEVNASRYEVRK